MPLPGNSEARRDRRRRARLWRAAGAATLSLALTGAVAGSANASSAPAYASEALATYQALQQNLYQPQDGLGVYLCDSGPCTGTNLVGTLWPFTNAFAATNYVAAVGGVDHKDVSGDVAARQSGLSAYYDPDETNPEGQPQPPAYTALAQPPLGTGSSAFYDDNAWVGLDEMYAYGATGNQTYLQHAEDIFSFVWSGWDTSTTGPCPGGVYWEDVADSPRNTVSNGPNAELGLLIDQAIYQATGQWDSSYLNEATQMYDWAQSCLENSNYMYNDHINPDGTINTALWSYNQGTMIGAGALLYQVTGEQKYLTQAEQTASASLSYYGADNRLDGQPDVFNVIMFRNLFYLSQLPGTQAQQIAAAAVTMAASYAQTAWTQDRQADGLISDPDPNGGEAPVNQTAPMAELYALLAGAPALMPASQNGNSQ